MIVAKLKKHLHKESPIKKIASDYYNQTTIFYLFIKE